MQLPKNKVLILGATTFTGKAIYHELCQYMEAYGTYEVEDETLNDNQAFYKLDASFTPISSLLLHIAPTVIISCLEGDYKDHYTAHEAIAYYVASCEECTLFYFSSDKVFDAKFEFPSYEHDVQASSSSFGKFKISVERLLLNTIGDQLAILRTPLVLGPYAPELIHLRQTIKNKANYEVYPNRIVSVTTVNKIAQQVHYLINSERVGIFHLASEDVIHHEDLIQEICEKAHGKYPVLQRVFSRNEDNYLAILPKHNPLPVNYQITVQQVIDDCTLNEEIYSLKI